jgi:tetratricopeptide (TPR) repeat protein
MLPDLTATARPVERQLRARYDAVTHALGDTALSEHDRAGAYGALGHYLLTATFFDEARLCYAHAEALEPTNALWPYLRGHAALRAGDRMTAAEAFDRTRALRPDYVPALVWLGDASLDLDRLDAAQRAFDSALTHAPESAAALFGAGRVALARGRYADAVSYLEHAKRADPRALTINYSLAMAYRGVGQADRSAALLQQRGNGAPELPDPLLQESDVVLDSAVSYESLGMQALRHRDWTGAAQIFRKGLDVAPGDASLRYWMATAMIASGDAAGAEREFRQVIRTQPDFAKAHFSLGAILDQRGQKDAALQEYEAAVRAAPNMPEARLRLADTLRLLNRMQPAVAQYEEAVRLDPGVAAAWLGGAQALIAVGDRARARDWIARGQRLHPGRPEWSALAGAVR